MGCKAGLEVDEEERFVAMAVIKVVVVAEVDDDDNECVCRDLTVRRKKDRQRPSILNNDGKFDTQNFLIRASARMQ
jgi:hypothetical protein